MRHVIARVIVAYQNQIAMEETLEAALERIFPSDAARTKAARAPAAKQARAADSGASDSTALARDTFRRAIEAQRSGDWARYGEEIERLGEILERMGGATPEE